MRDNSSPPFVKCTRQLRRRLKIDRTPARKSSVKCSISRCACTWRHCAAKRPTRTAAKGSRIALEAGTGQGKKNVFEVGRANDHGAAVSFVVTTNTFNQMGGVVDIKHQPPSDTQAPFRFESVEQPRLFMWCEIELNSFRCEPGHNQFGRSSRGDHLARGNDCDLIAEPLRLVHVMRRDENRRSCLA